MVNETGQLSNQVKNTHMGFLEVLFEVGASSLSTGISMTGSGFLIKQIKGWNRG